jgi:penicillin-binding protein 1C
VIDRFLAFGARFRGGRRRARRWAFTALALAFVAVFAFFWRRSALVAPEPTLLVRDRHSNFLGELPARGDDRLGFWKLPAIPERVAAATTAIEDQRFRWHPGVDPLAIARAVRQNASSRERVSGASTLAMQVARFQHPGRLGERGYARKAVEALTAVALTLRHGRDDVLRHYLRIVPYGNRVHGIGYAARRYLDKPVEDLSWAEVAFLSAIPQSPARMNPYDPLGRQRAIRRGVRILDVLRERGELSERDHAIAREEIEHLRLPWRGTRPAAAIHALLAFRDRVPATAAPALTSTLDLELQVDVERLAAQAVSDAADRGAGNASVLVVERPKEGANAYRVRAAVSSTDYFDARRSGAIDYLRLPRSSGSTLKPFLFAQALDRRVIDPTTVLDDLEPGPGGILNSDERFLGPLLPRVALANSRNVPAVELLRRVGLDPFYALLGDLGLHRHEQPARRYGLGLAIGSLPVTLEELVRAYTTLAGDGTLRDLRWLEADGGAPQESAAVTAAASATGRFSPETARELALFLSDPQARLPTFPRMGFAEYPFAVAVKTGTSSRYRDAWTLAWSRRYLVGVWVGHPDEQPMTQLSGYRVAARLAQAVIERLHGEEMRGQSAFDFAPPAGYHSERLCALTGKRATPACDRVVLEWLPPEASSSLSDCTAHRLVAVDRRSGAVATAATPEEDLEARTFVELPARYAGWLERAGLPALEEALDDAHATGGAAQPALADLDRAISIEITSPEPGLRILLDPETPTELNTLALRAAVEPAVPQLVWYVDDVPVATVRAPYTHRWRLTPGEHVAQARVPYRDARSRRIRFVVE